MKITFKTLLIPFFLLILLVSACRQDYSQLAQVETRDAPVRVTTETIAITDAPIPIEAVGLLSGSSEMKHAFKIGGIIHRVYVEEGDRFRAGQVLAELELKEINAQVSKAREGVAKWVRDQARVEQLYADTVATLEQLQDIRTGLDVAKADLEIAEYNQRYARIVARADGRVLRRFAEPGELTAPGTPILMVSHSQGGQFVLKVGLADKDVVRLRLNDTAQVAFDAFPGEVFTATADAIAPQADPMTGAFEVELRLDARGFPMRHGFVGKATLFPATGRAYYKVPIDAVVEADQDRARIFLADLETQTAQAQTVPLSRIGKDYILVDTSSLALHQPVVVGGAAYLENAQKISIQ